MNMKLEYEGVISAIAGQVGSDSVYTASHTATGYLIVTALSSGTSATIPQFAKILAGTNFAGTGLVIIEPKLQQTPAHTITSASSSTISSNAVTLTFNCTGIMNWVNGSTVVIAGMTPSTYDGTYVMTGVTTNTSFTVSKTLNGTDGAAGLPNATAFGTAIMTISSTITGLYKTNLTSAIGSQTNLTFTAPNIVPSGTKAISVFNSTTSPVDIMFYNPVSKVLESVCLPSGIPTRLSYFDIPTAVYASTAISGTSFNKAVFWTVYQ
jgi:hypothetical protein